MRLMKRKAYIRFIPDMEGVPEHISKIHIDKVEYDQQNRYKIICGHTDNKLNVKIDIPDELTALLIG